MTQNLTSIVLFFCTILPCFAQTTTSNGTYDFINFSKKDQYKTGYTTTQYRRIQGAPDGSVFVLGSYANTLDPDNLNIPSESSNLHSCFIIKFDKTGNVVWKDTISPKPFLDINGNPQKRQRLAVDLALDPDGNPVVLTECYFGKTVFNPYKSHYQFLEYKLIRYDKQNGSRKNEKEFQIESALENYLTYIFRIAVDKANCTYIAIEAMSNTSLRLDGLGFAGGGKNLIKLNPQLNGIWVKNINQFNGTHEIAEIATDDSCNVYMNARSFANQKAGVIISKYDSSGAVRWQNNFVGINNIDMYHPVGVAVIGNAVYASVYHKNPGLTVEGVLRRKSIEVDGTTYYPTGTAIYKLNKNSGTFIDFTTTLVRKYAFNYGFRASQVVQQGNYLYLTGASQLEDFTLGDFHYPNSTSVLMAKDQVLIKIDTAFQVQAFANTFAHRFSETLISPTEEGKIAWAGTFVHSTSFYQNPGKISNTTVPNYGGNQDHLFLTVVTPVAPTITKQTQTISFSAPSDTASAIFPISRTLTASSSSGLPVVFSVLSGPATISGNTIVINDAGTIVVKASQGGDNAWEAAPEIERNFSVTSTTTSLTDKSSTSEIYIYPNPSTGSFYLIASDEIESVLLTDALGRQETVKGKTEIRSNLKGLVLVRIKTRKGIFIEKIILE
jgi:hypothetical protein